MFKIVFSVSILLLAGISSFGQVRMPSKDNPSLKAFPIVAMRTEIVLPEVNGYKVLKADLHTHTIYSDAGMMPYLRVDEAFRDGLDVIALTDHIEFRPNEKRLLGFLADGVTVNKGEEGEILSDLNSSYRDVVSKARHHGIVLIPGAEITREVEVGHFNCLFTTDVNKIYDEDPLQSIRNAKAQGALVQHNHPGWRKPDNSFTSVAEAALKEGLLDGVEIINTEEFYPDVIEKALSEGLYVSGGTDIHTETYDNHLRYGYYRNMTLIFAKEASLESVREALEAKRTLAYGFGDIAGGEDLLKDFFRASVSLETMYIGSKGDIYLRLKNSSSIPYTISIPKSPVPFVLEKFSSYDFHLPKGTESLPVTVHNMWFGETLHPEIVYQVEDCVAK